MLRAKAFRADLWRWMILWHNGGIYMDAKMAFTTPADSWIDFENEEFIIGLDYQMKELLDNALIVLTKHHPYGLMMIQ